MEALIIVSLGLFYLGLNMPIEKNRGAKENNSSSPERYTADLKKYIS